LNISRALTFSEPNDRILVFICTKFSKFRGWRYNGIVDKLGKNRNAAVSLCINFMNEPHDHQVWTSILLRLVEL